MKAGYSWLRSIDYSIFVWPRTKLRASDLLSTAPMNICILSYALFRYLITNKCSIFDNGQCLAHFFTNLFFWALNMTGMKRMRTSRGYRHMVSLTGLSQQQAWRQLSAFWVVFLTCQLDYHKKIAVFVDT